MKRKKNIDWRYKVIDKTVYFGFWSNWC